MLQTDLLRFWHVIALSSELRPKTSLKRNLYDQRILIWRDSANRVHAILDCCLHRQAPLAVSDYSSNIVKCPYHGWEYDASGKLTHVPSDPEASSRLRCQIPNFQVIDYLGFLWIKPDFPPSYASTSAQTVPRNRTGSSEDYHEQKHCLEALSDSIELEPFSSSMAEDWLRNVSTKSDQSFPQANNSPLSSPEQSLENWLGLSPYLNWSVIYQTKIFETTDELLIENFMDPTHTSMVHDGIIRSSKQQREHRLTLEKHKTGVRVLFDEMEESVGVGLRAIYGKSMKVMHRDEFFLPNLVKVTYQINGQERFIALIACTPIDISYKPRTQAFIQIRHNFGCASSIANPFIQTLAKKVLAQDYKITAMQFENRRHFSNLSEVKVAADAVFVRIRECRELANDQSARTSTTQSLTITF